MGGGSAKPFRPADGNVARRGDLLPTPELLARLKVEAWERAQRKAFGLGWPVGPAGLAILQAAPIVAMRALNQICPAPVGRLAAWLRVDGREAATGWNASQSSDWVAETASEIAALLEAEAQVTIVGSDA